MPVSQSVSLPPVSAPVSASLLPALTPLCLLLLPCCRRHGPHHHPALLPSTTKSPLPSTVTVIHDHWTPIRPTGFMDSDLADTSSWFSIRPRSYDCALPPGCTSVVLCSVFVFIGLFLYKCGLSLNCSWLTLTKPVIMLLTTCFPQIVADPQWTDDLCCSLRMTAFGSWYCR